MENEEKILSTLENILHELKNLSVMTEKITEEVEDVKVNTKEISNLAADWNKIKETLG